MGGVERYATSSSLLLGAWNLGMGAPTFLAGAVLQTAAHPADDMTLVGGEVRLRVRLGLGSGVRSKVRFRRSGSG